MVEVSERSLEATIEAALLGTMVPAKKHALRPLARPRAWRWCREHQTHG
jgi:hypothetical protein